MIGRNIMSIGKTHLPARFIVVLTSVLDSYLQLCRPRHVNALFVGPWDRAPVHPLRCPQSQKSPDTSNKSNSVLHALSS
jgi:hypothetical protein